MKDFYLRNCGEIKLEVIELWGDDSTSQLKILDIHSVNQMQLPCKWLICLCNLESLSLDSCWCDEMKSLCLPQLKVLNISNFGGSVLLTISGFRSLQQLQRLMIINCALLEEIVEDIKGGEHAEMDTKTIFRLLELNSVFFSCLPNLKSFIHGANYECYMPSLKEVEVRNCGLLSLFTCSVSRNLHQLETLVLYNCRLLEGIVEDRRRKTINFPKLKSLWLMHLRSLKSFCNMACGFNINRYLMKWYALL